MWMTIIFRIIFWLGVVIAVLSLVIPVELFLLVLLTGVVFICYSLFEQHLIKRDLPVAAKPSFGVSRQKKSFFSFFQKFFPKRKSTGEVVVSPLPAKPIPKSMRLPKKPLPTFPAEHKKRGMLSWLQHLFKKKPVVIEPSIKHAFLKDIPHFTKIKKLFQQDISMPAEPQGKQSFSIKKIIAKRFTKTPEKVSGQVFPWEKEEHYIPTGAEQLRPEEAAREEVADVADERYGPAVAKDVEEPVSQPEEEAVMQRRLFKEFTPPKAKEIKKKLPASGDVATLKKYIEDALAAHYPLEHIKVAVLQAGWPKNLVKEVFTSLDVLADSANKKKKLLTLGGLVLFLVILLVVLQMTDLLLLDYFTDYLSYASLEFYISAVVIFLIVIVVFAFKTKKLLKEKKVLHTMKESKHVQEIKTELQLQKKGFETDFDRLYSLVKERKKLTVGEVAKGFGIGKEKAEEWGKILKEHNLIELHYPPVGEPELLWKK